MTDKLNKTLHTLTIKRNDGMEDHETPLATDMLILLDGNPLSGVTGIKYNLTMDGDIRQKVSIDLICHIEIIP